MTSKATIHKFAFTLLILRGLLIAWEYTKNGITPGDIDQLNVATSFIVLGLIALYIVYRMLEGAYHWYDALPNNDFDDKPKWVN